MRAVVLERGDFGIGASTQRRHGLRRHQSRQGKVAEPDRRRAERNKAALMGMVPICHRAGRHHRPQRIECGLLMNGRFVGAWTPMRHGADMATKVDLQHLRQRRQPHGAARAPARDDRLTITSAACTRSRAGHLHPATLLQGPASRRRIVPAPSCAPTSEAERIEEDGDGAATNSKLENQKPERYIRSALLTNQPIRRNRASMKNHRRQGTPEKMPGRPHPQARHQRHQTGRPPAALIPTGNLPDL